MLESAHEVTVVMGTSSLIRVAMAGRIGKRRSKVGTKEK